MMNQGSPHILVVDDHSEIRDLLKRFLSNTACASAVPVMARR